MRISVRVLARTVFDYLVVRSAGLEPVDVIFGFGHFDPKIPARCCELYRRGYASRLVFTGGVGAGTAYLSQSEALYFRDEAMRVYPEIPEDAILLEPESTHTGENIRYSLQKLEDAGWGHNPSSGLHRVILVANAYRQRRVGLAWRRHAPRVTALHAPPETTFEDERSLFAEKGQDLVAFLVGEVDRIVRYGARGYIVNVDVPEDILNACAQLRDLGYEP
jgi:hypothetical protein